jgi:hypothetical protein
MLRPLLSQYITQILSPCGFSCVHHHPLGPLSLWSSDSALCLYLILLLITHSSDFLKKLNSKNSLVPVFLIGKIGIKTSKNPWFS